MDVTFAETSNSSAVIAFDWWRNRQEKPDAAQYLIRLMKSVRAQTSIFTLLLGNNWPAFKGTLESRTRTLRNQVALVFWIPVCPSPREARSGYPGLFSASLAISARDRFLSARATKTLVPCLPESSLANQSRL